MRIALIHYHLKAGGVTTVIRHQVEALADSADVMVLTGEPPETTFPAETVCIPGLGYDAVADTSNTPEEVAEAVIRAIRSRWRQGCDVLHVHNPTLAKNRRFLTTLKILQKRRIRLFLQIHDFAEDGRPSLYYADDYVRDCHYGVINSRDYELLLGSGLNRNGLHQLPNIVSPIGMDEGKPIRSAYVLYPVRALRRKNIGEALLLSCCFKAGETLAVTLPPNSRPDLRSHSDWKRFAAEMSLPAVFDVGLTEDFESLVRSAPYLISTSITEGFGLAFVEPWTAGKLLWGRRLPLICRDFRQNGLRLDHLYDRLRVPPSWIGPSDFFEKWKSCILKRCRGFQFDIDEARIDRAFKKMTENDAIDFGLLDEPFQRRIIHRISEDHADAARLIRLNPFLDNPGHVPNTGQLIEHNRRAVLAAYNRRRYRESLVDIYSRVVKQDVSHGIDKHMILSYFIDPETFSLLKWSEYAD